MKIEFEPSFLRDLNKIKEKNIKQEISNLLECIEKEKKLSNIKNIKKIKGHKTAYRIKIKDYRIGFYFENGIVIFSRVLHRKDIYKLFP